jgi:hypothetical protein
VYLSIKQEQKIKKKAPPGRFLLNQNIYANLKGTSVITTVAKFAVAVTGVAD